MLFETDAALIYRFEAAAPQPAGFNWPEIERQTGNTRSSYYACRTMRLLLVDAAATLRATEQQQVAEATSAGYLGREPECRGARWQGYCSGAALPPKRATAQDKLDHEINLWTRPL